MPTLEVTQYKNDPVIAEFMAMTDKAHLAEMMSLKGDIIERLERFGKGALVWKLKGKNLEDIGMNGMTKWLVWVGEGKLYAPLLAKTMHNDVLTHKVARLPLADQKLIGDGGTVEMLTVANNGKPTQVVQVPLSEIRDKQQTQQLMAENHIRTIPEQRLWIEARRQQAAMPLPERIGKYALDAERGVSKFLGKRGDEITWQTHREIYLALKPKHNES